MALSERRCRATGASSCIGHPASNYNTAAIDVESVQRLGATSKQAYKTLRRRS